MTKKNSLKAAALSRLIQRPYTMNPVGNARPKAFSYVRFSSLEQARGHSLERQTRQAREYAERRELDLDTEFTFRDLGVSAYTGQNANKGALWLFRRAVEDGEVPAGSYLLIENFDRLSRMEPWDAIPIFQEIINNGITIVTLQDGQEWNREGIRENPYRLFAALSVMIRAHEESNTKGLRIRAVNDKKRSQAAKGKPFTTKRPGWLDWNKDTKQFEVIPERAKIVQEIYETADQGRSYHRIAQIFNERGEPTWGNSAHWHGSYVRKVLTTSAVVGTWTPHVIPKVTSGPPKRIPQAPIENYFPTVVERELYERVTARLKSTAARGRNAGAAPKSIFAGLMKCGHCGATVTRVNKGEHVYLLCTKAHAKAGCRYQTVRYADTEERFCEYADWLIDHAPRGRDTSEIEQQIEYWENTVFACEDEAKDLAELAREERSAGARRAWQEAEKNHARAQEQLKKHIADRDRLTSKTVTRKLEAIRTALTRKPLDVVEANRVLREAINKVVMNPEDAVLWVFWHHAADPSDPISIYSRHKLWVEGGGILQPYPTNGTEETGSAGGT
jgi:DNA invertase Pin-like site-specific DNA recombinase